eukprot:767654-Hanusia_phi.AAC.1
MKQKRGARSEEREEREEEMLEEGGRVGDEGTDLSNFLSVMIRQNKNTSQHLETFGHNDLSYVRAANKKKARERQEGLEREEGEGKIKGETGKSRGLRGRGGR